MTLEYEVIPCLMQMRGKLVNHYASAHFPVGFIRVTQCSVVLFLLSEY